ncbi:ATP-binding cassette domain-containing protein [Chishuiella sp.]|uniref:ATP-binding cassette domain-containing protein n=1 Tax=Chishuiella sp. TaxID=1969467 RepID=UPI0028A77444|nr:ATP-binding cassette domain-containing protein [Chishuiella sp.]
MNPIDLNIEIKEINYGSKKVVLENISININQFGIYGVFGKNGQGKSTFLKSLAGIKSFIGEINLNNSKLTSDLVAYIDTEPIVYEYLTAKEFYKFYQKVSGKKTNINPDNLFDIDDNIILKSMSTGTLKKAYINTILQFDDYNIYIFDEPFNGLDIESNYILIEKLKQLAKCNIVFVSSHILEVIQPFLDNIFFVNDKKIIEIDSSQLYYNLQKK